MIDAGWIFAIQIRQSLFVFVGTCSMGLESCKDFAFKSSREDVRMGQSRGHSLIHQGLVELPIPVGLCLPKIEFWGSLYVLDVF